MWGPWAVEMWRPGGRDGRHFDLLDFGLLKAFGFGTSVLEPDFDLCFGQMERAGELRPFSDAQVLLLAELLLETQQLLGGERCPGLAVGLVLA